ncbi:uncharacterized protein LOC132745640 [Ruditapes philippinarum]|uniref:uncharacterized protein LOC132745640 n=1 Tax=Ruditapes philippinarum TaxID=129788 RepID=UPI00295B7173|nr:uncharacterized protein LOC132745640 [Ruditapes philippinarum]
MYFARCIYNVRLILLLFISATCSKPALNTNSYTLTEEKSSYQVNETYEIYCVPGYVSSGGSDLICGTSGSWSIPSPECTPSEGTYPWWMLLVAVLLVILLVSCILPRFLQCCLSKGKKKQGGESRDLEQNNDNYDDYDDDDDDDRGDSPVPNFGKHKKMTNIEYMSKLHEDADRKTLKRAAKNSTF